ncbi:MAG: hypothetical protein Q9174_006730, partial [Haloplaca sp. 1 TL-2023]
LTSDILGAVPFLTFLLPLLAAYLLAVYFKPENVANRAYWKARDEEYARRRQEAQAQAALKPTQSTTAPPQWRPNGGPQILPMQTPVTLPSRSRVEGPDQQRLTIAEYEAEEAFRIGTEREIRKRDEQFPWPFNFSEGILLLLATPYHVLAAAGGLFLGLVLNANMLAQDWVLPILKGAYEIVSPVWDGRLLAHVRGVRDAVVEVLVYVGYGLFEVWMLLRWPAACAVLIKALWWFVPWLYDLAVEHDWIPEWVFSAGRILLCLLFLAALALIHVIIFGHNNPVKICDLCKSPPSGQQQHHFTNGRNLCADHHHTEFLRIQEEIQVAHFKKEMADSRTGSISGPTQQFSPVPLAQELPRQSTFSPEYSFGGGEARRSDCRLRTPAIPRYQLEGPATKYWSPDMPREALSLRKETPDPYKGSNPVPHRKVDLDLPKRPEPRRSMRIAGQRRYR